jgi:probable F420-dependent oxidoreductase
MELRFGDRGEAQDAVAELDELGFGAIWTPGAIDDRIMDDVTALLGATRRAVIGTGIINVWKVTPAQVGAWWKGASEAERSRVLLGLGVSHGPIIEGWGKPIETMTAYLDGLDAEGVPRDSLCLAALGPKMLALSAARTAGAHPYLVSAEHTAFARRVMGPDALLAPEVGVILETDPDKARTLARSWMENYLRLPNYRNAWKRLGFSEAETLEGSDRLIDALFAWGSIDQIAARVQAHLDAGADHVALQVAHGPPGDFSFPRAAWRELASALL